MAQRVPAIRVRRFADCPDARQGAARADGDAMTFLTGVFLGAFLSASAGDAVTTHQARARGASEGNPLLQHEAVMLGTKAAGGVATTVFAAKFEKTHPVWTRVILMAGSGAYLTLAMRNARTQR